MLTWPLPGQRMWLAWCGGLNLAEFGFFFFLMGVVFCWLRYGLDGGYKYYNDGKEYGPRRKCCCACGQSRTPWGGYQPPYRKAGVCYLRAVQAVVDIDDMRPWLNLER